jgi:putative peptidoglycan lipid II flippase
LTLVVKAAGAAKELVVAYRFGTDPELGAFVYAFVFPAFLITVVAGSLQAALVPRFIHVGMHEGPTAAALLAARTAGLAFLGLLAAILIISPLATALVPRLATGFDERTLSECRNLVLLLMPVVVFSGLSAVWSGILNAEGRFAAPAAVPIVTSLSVATALLIFDMKSAYVLAGATVLGAAVECAIVAALVSKRLEPMLSIPTNLRLLDRALVLQFLAAAAASALMAGSMLIEQSFAASNSAADVAAYAFGTRFTTVVGTVIVTTMSTILLPYFAKRHASDGASGLGRVAPRVVAVALAISLPCAVAFLFGSHTIVEIVLQRGRFDAASAAAVAAVQAVHALYLPVFCLGMIATRMIAAAGRTQLLIAVSAVNLVASWLLNAALVPRFGVVGIAWANVGMYSIGTTVLWAFVLRDARRARIAR